MVYCCGARRVRAWEVEERNWRAKPANTPIVEQARGWQLAPQWHLCLGDDCQFKER